MDDYDFESWNYTDLPESYSKAYSEHDKFLFSYDIYGYIVFINQNDFEINLTNR